MNSKQLAERLEILIRQERKITEEVLELIQICLEKRTYLELGFASMFDWLVKGFGYSNAAAQRRIETARLLKSVPQAKEKLKEGRVNLTTLSKAQTVIRQQEKLSGTKVSQAAQEKVIEMIEQKSALETERVLVSLFPETASIMHQERKTVINEHQVRHQMNLANEASHNIQRAKEVLSHKFPNASDAEVVAYALEFLLAKIDLLRKVDKKAGIAKPKSLPEGLTLGIKVTSDRVSTSAAEVETKAGQRRLVIRNSGGRCSFSSREGHVCGSTYQTQLDHIIPKALGGSDHPSNLRVLCRQHNLLMAERIFGKKLMDGYRRDS